MPTTAERAAPPRWRSRAFGLELEGSFDAPGLPPVAGGLRDRLTRVELVPTEQIDAVWPGEGTARLLEERAGGSTAERTIDHHATAGYRLYARGFGLALVSGDGELVRCAPPGDAAWRWQRFLIGRVLPWAALLRGFEVFHASAVELDGRAVALIGPSGVGKTSLAVQLVLGGARFMTDDVLALDRGIDGPLRAHPGASIASLRAAERDGVADRNLSRLGSFLGHDDKTYMALARAPVALPLGAVYFITRGDEADADAIEPLPAPDPRVLLASTFVLSVRTPERLRNLLNTCADIACSVPAFRVRVQSGVGADALAQELHAHARTTLAGGP
jgi:hypothetical protein